MLVGRLLDSIENLCVDRCGPRSSYDKRSMNEVLEHLVRSKQFAVSELWTAIKGFRRDSLIVSLLVT